MHGKRKKCLETQEEKSHETPVGRARVLGLRLGTVQCHACVEMSRSRKSNRVVGDVWGPEWGLESQEKDMPQRRGSDRPRRVCSEVSRWALNWPLGLELDSDLRKHPPLYQPTSWTERGQELSHPIDSGSTQWADAEGFHRPLLGGWVRMGGRGQCRGSSSPILQVTENETQGLVRRPPPTPTGTQVSSVTGGFFIHCAIRNIVAYKMYWLGCGREKVKEVFD